MQVVLYDGHKMVVVAVILRSP